MCGGRFEVRLADAEIDDVASLALQLGRLRQHGEGVLLADAREGRIDWDQRELRRRGPLIGKGAAKGKRHEARRKRSAPAFWGGVDRQRPPGEPKGPRF